MKHTARRLLHPRTGKQLHPLGYRKSGAPIWPIMGGDGTEPDANAWTEVFGDKSPEDVKKALDDALAQPGGDSPWDDLFKDQKPEDVKAAVDESRKWESRSKANKTKADAYDALVEKITGKSDEDQPDPEKLAGDLTAAQRETRATKVENAILRRAGKHEADAGMLVDSRTFMASVADLDPSADDFTSKVDDAIKKAVDDNDAFRVVVSTGPRPVRQQGKPSKGKQGGIQAGAELYNSRRPKRAGATS